MSSTLALSGIENAAVLAGSCATMGFSQAGWLQDQREKKSVVTSNLENQGDLGLWVRQSREGDSQAMARIYERFRIPLYNLAYRYTYNSAAAEDLLQDIFIKAFTSLDKLTADEAFAGWLYRQAINTCLSYLRSRKTFLRKNVPLGEVEDILSEGVNQSPEDLMGKFLDDAIQALPPKIKSVFLLHDVQGFKHEEISQLLGISEGTSKSQLFKARMKIRKNFESRGLV